MLKESIGHPLLSISPLWTKGRDGQAGLKAVLKESIGHPLLSISPLWTKGRDRQAGLNAVLKKSIGPTLLSVIPLGLKVMEWTSMTKDSVKGVNWTSFIVH